MRLPVNRNLPLAALVFLLAACGGSGGGFDPLPPSPTGPAGDYPMVLGPAYTIGTVNYTPADTLNYDAVGVAEVSGEGGPAITVSHHTLPLPSYVEVTTLDTGRTILARVERRGPMTGNQLIQLSPGAAAQLGLTTQSSVEVRVRRVNPPEQERVLLRSGQQAPLRMDTPKSLLDVLHRRLSQQNGELTRAPAPMPPEGAVPPPTGPVVKPEPQAVPPKAPAAKAPVTKAPVEKAPATKPQAAKPPVAKSPVAKPPKALPPKPAPVEPVAAPSPTPPASGNYVVQVGAFSDKARAEAVATKAGGQVSPGGKVFRVRMGPFKTQAEADAALAKARASGYSDARIQRGN